MNERELIYCDLAGHVGLLVFFLIFSLAEDPGYHTLPLSLGLCSSLLYVVRIPGFIQSCNNGDKRVEIHKTLCSILSITSQLCLLFSNLIFIYYGFLR